MKNKIAMLREVDGLKLEVITTGNSKQLYVEYYAWVNKRQAVGNSYIASEFSDAEILRDNFQRIITMLGMRVETRLEFY